VLLLPRKWTVRYNRLYAGSTSWLFCKIVGVTIEIRGQENIPKGANIVASKHQSVWETFSLVSYLSDPALVLKRELMNIPFYGWFLRKLEMVPINRGSAVSSLRAMIKAAKKAVKQDRQITIFPEGTRKTPGDKPDYKIGVYYIYSKLDLPCIPVALNSGYFWPRHQFIRHPGNMVIQFLPPIPPGLSRKEFMEELERRIENCKLPGRDH